MNSVTDSRKNTGMMTMMQSGNNWKTRESSGNGGLCEACFRPLTGTKRKRFCNDACLHVAYRYRKSVAARGIPDSPVTHLGPFQSYQSVYAGKVDVIITDPPYGRDYEKLYTDLAAFAMDVLVPGGWLLCLTGWGIDYEARTAFNMAGLEYLTIVTFLMQGSMMQASKNTSCGARKWRQQAKPILWYQKKGSKLNRRRAGTSDLIVATGNLDQSQFHWQQCVDAYKQLVVNFTNPQDVLCDPCMGSGTTLVAAKAMGRKRIVGIEKDVETYRIACERVGKME